MAPRRVDVHLFKILKKPFTSHSALAFSVRQIIVGYMKWCITVLELVLNFTPFTCGIVFIEQLDFIKSSDC